MCGRLYPAGYYFMAQQNEQIYKMAGYPAVFFYAFMQIRMGDIQFHVVRYRAAFAGSRRSGYCHKRRIGQINSLVLKYSQPPKANKITEGERACWYASMLFPFVQTSGGHHSSPVMHVRRAHYHTFLCGKGRKWKRLKWLPPVIVNRNQEPVDIVTITKVKKEQQVKRYFFWFQKN